MWESATTTDSSHADTNARTRRDTSPMEGKGHSLCQGAQHTGVDEEKKREVSLSVAPGGRTNTSDSLTLRLRAAYSLYDRE